MSQAATYSAPPLPALSLAGSAKFTRIFSRLLLVCFVAFVIGILWLPWRQFVSGAGRVIAFNPLDRRINIEAQVAGRVKHLHVTEGQRVKKGELIIEIQDNDPNLLNNLKAQREAIESRRDFANGRVESLTAQITQQELAKAQAIDGAEQRVAAAKIGAETSQLNYNRTKDLFEKKLESQRNFELATLSRDSTIAELKSAEAALKRTSNDFDATITNYVEGALSTRALRSEFIRGHSHALAPLVDMPALQRLEFALEVAADVPRESLQPVLRS